jgi:hypothetical protein
LLVSNWHGLPGSVKGNRMHHKWNRVRAALEGQGLVERVEFRRDDRKVPETHGTGRSKVLNSI